MPDVFNDNVNTETATPDANVEAVKVKFGNDLDKLAKGKAEADAFIEQLKSEQAHLREELNAKVDRDKNAEASLEELRNEIKALRGTIANPSGQSKENTNPVLTADGIQALIQDSLTRAERDKSAQQNVEAANKAVVDHFGSLDKAGEAVKAKAAELGMSISDLKNIASKSPSAFRKIIVGDAIDASADTALDPNSSQPPVNDGQKPNVITPKSKEDFEAIRKADPKRYWAAATQMQLHKAARDGTYQL